MLAVLTALAGLAALTGRGTDRNEVPTRIEPAGAPLPRAQPVALDVAGTHARADVRTQVPVGGHGAIEPAGRTSNAPVSRQPTPEGPDGSTGD